MAGKAMELPELLGNEDVNYCEPMKRIIQFGKDNI
jgi:hypothetical protein